METLCSEVVEFQFSNRFILPWTTSLNGVSGKKGNIYYIVIYFLIKSFYRKSLSELNSAHWASFFLLLSSSRTSRFASSSCDDGCAPKLLVLLSLKTQLKQQNLKVAYQKRIHFYKTLTYRLNDFRTLWIPSKVIYY